VSSSLAEYTAAASARLHDSLDEATAVSFPFKIRDLNARIDAFLAVSCRHVTALESVLVDAVRSHLDEPRARDLTRACHSLQLALRTMHARLYGSSQLMRVPWQEIREDVHHRLEALLSLENDLANELAARSTRGLDDLAARLHTAELHAPTRPHPHLPRRGLRGRLARRAAARADAFWDSVQGRVVAGSGTFVAPDPTTGGAA
jgi:hypothetical protein